MSSVERRPVANAPVSYGAFELTIGQHADVPAGTDVLDRVRAAGYAGIDLGPVGYLGEGADLATHLEKFELGLAGGYLELPFHTPDALTASMGDLALLLDAFDAAAPVNARLGLPAPCPTIAISGRPDRQLRPGRAAADRSAGFADAEWEVVATGAERVAVECRQRGYRPVFHNEIGTNVEAAWEIAQILERTSFDACLDTGHLLAAGDDPVAFLLAWGPRIGHLHVKSARGDFMAAIVAEGQPADEVWSRGVFCRLGEGDLELASLVAAMDEVGYVGWVLVEHDILPSPGSLVRAQADQMSNRAALRALGV